MSDPPLATRATTLVEYSVRLEPGMLAVIVGGVTAQPWMRAIAWSRVATSSEGTRRR